MTELSVIICSHDPRSDYLWRVLKTLAAQTLPKESWELILIDNASANALHERYSLAWHLHGRHVREENLGLTHARLRGIAESKADILVFVDDDNLLDDQYLQHVVGIASKYPRLGAWSGNVQLERLTEAYFLRLVQSIQFSSYVLQMCRNPAQAPPAITWWWWIKFICDTATRFGRKRRFYLANKRAQREARALYDSLRFATQSGP